MEQTVIGIFEKASDVQHAAEQLRSNGFSDQAIDLNVQSADAKGIMDTNELYIRDRGTDYPGDSIGRFFRSLFDNREEAERFSTVAKQNSVVAVHANSVEEAERAVQILDSCGALNVDEHIRDFNTTADPSSLTGSQTGRRADGKQEGESDAIRVHSRIVERPAGDRSRLREEPSDRT